MWSLVHAATWLFGGLLSAKPPTDLSFPLLQSHTPNDLLSPSSLSHTNHVVLWADARSRADKLVSNMTISEKVNITSGVVGPCQANSGSVDRLGIPSFCYNDGPAGLRYTDFVTQFPSQFTTALSFDRGLVHEMTVRISREFRGKGVNVELGPLTGGPLGRSPFGGRNWEGFSPDPYLCSTLSYQAIHATQSTGLIACAKHYFLYEQEPVCNGPLDDDGGRTDCEDIHSWVDDKTVKELYLPSFAEAVRAGVGAVMCSYNQINDTPSCQSSDSMTRILKNELNFQGYVLSDFGATHSTVESANAGLDQELPGTYFFGESLKTAVKEGKINETRLDDMVRRILTPWIALGQADSWPEIGYQKWDLSDVHEEGGRRWHNLHQDNRGDNAAFVRQVAEQSHVLLKNEDDVLPLNGVRRIALFGSDADYPATISGCGGDLFCLEGSKKRYWNGTVTIGGGSGAAYANYIVPPIEAISIRARQQGVRVDHVLYDDAVHFPTVEAVAKTVEVCIVFGAVFLVEGWDRATLRLDRNGEDLIKKVEKTCAGDVVVVLHVGGQITMEDWIDLPKIKGVIFAGYPGQESGNALANILWGDVNPSGKLSFTMGRKASDWPPGNILRDDDACIRGSEPPRVYFSEGLAIDYKWFDKHKIDPRFEFGYGQSYTTFELADLRVIKSYQPVRDTIQPTNEQHEGGGDLYDVLYVAQVNVTNTGAVYGGEVPQLYMSFPKNEKEQPPRHLRGYDKIFLEPGHSRTVYFPLRKKDLSVWDVQRQLWRLAHGEYVFTAGQSSRKLSLETILKIEPLL